VKGTCIEMKMLRPPYRFLNVRKANGLEDQRAARFALDGLIERELLAQEAEKQGVTVSEAEVTESVAKGHMYLSTPGGVDPPQLGVDGGVVVIDDLVPPSEKEKAEEEGLSDEQALERWLKALTNTTPAEFRKWQERELLAAKMRDRVGASLKASDEEAFQRFVEERTTATVDYVFVDREWIEKYAIRADDKEIEAWALANPAKIRVPVRNIVITGATPEEQEAAKQKAEALVVRVKAGEDLAQLAKEFSEDPETKEKGGLNTADEVDTFVEDFQAAVKNLKPGELAPTAVKTSYGWHVMKREPSTREINQASFVKVRSAELAQTIAREILAARQGGKTLGEATAAALAKYGKFGKGAAAAAADSHRPQVTKSQPFHRGAEPLAQISPDEEKKIAAFGFQAAPDQLMAEPIGSLGGAHVIQANGRIVPTKEDFAKERDLFVAMVLRVKRGEELRGYLKRLRDAAKDEISIDEAKLWPADGGAPRKAATAAPPPP
jgi:peptidyl-prolyl cis-trans isomerase D